MPITLTILSCGIKRGLRAVNGLNKSAKCTFATAENTQVQESRPSTDNKSETSTLNDNGETKIKISGKDVDSEDISPNYRFTYPEFLPDPNPIYRNALRERLERMDMLARRSHLTIPEFYVGSILAVTFSEPHAPGKTNRFVGICIQRKGTGLRASFLLRNVVDNQGVEMLFDMYDPAIQKIECLRLEKRLDNELIYLRDAPLEYSTFPFDMEVEILPKGAPVPLNDIKVPLKPPPWVEKYEIKGYKGLQDFVVSERKRKRAERHATPWEKYDIMKTYRETIPEEEQKEIFAEIQTRLQELEIAQQKQRYKRTIARPKKRG